MKDRKTLGKCPLHIRIMSVFLKLDNTFLQGIWRKGKRDFFLPIQDLLENTSKQSLPSSDNRFELMSLSTYVFYSNAAVLSIELINICNSVSLFIIYYYYI